MKRFDHSDAGTVGGHVDVSAETPRYHWTRSRRQWRHATNIWRNSMIRSVLQTTAAPVIGLTHMVRRDKNTAQT